MEESRILHITEGQKYEVQFERSAVKGQDGFKVRANGDSIEETFKNAQQLYANAIAETALNSIPVVPPAGK